MKMSCFIHTDEAFNTLAKYFRNEIGFNESFTEDLINNLFRFEQISFYGRYKEKDTKTKVTFVKGKPYRELEEISNIDALKFLDSIKYQSSDVPSDKLWERVLSIHRKLTDGIVQHSGIDDDYEKTEEYRLSEWW